MIVNSPFDKYFLSARNNSSAHEIHIKEKETHKINDTLK